jgi:hypothetical protein
MSRLNFSEGSVSSMLHTDALLPASAHTPAAQPQQQPVAPIRPQPSL